MMELNNYKLILRETCPNSLCCKRHCCPISLAKAFITIRVTVYVQPACMHTGGNYECDPA